MEALNSHPRSNVHRMLPLRATAYRLHHAPPDERLCRARLDPVNLASALHVERLHDHDILATVCAELPGAGLDVARADALLRIV